MVSRDFIKYNKKKLRLKKDEIKGEMLTEWIKTGNGRNKRRKFFLVGKKGEKIIKQQEFDEILNNLEGKKYKNQKNIIDKRLSVTERLKGDLTNKQGVEFSSIDLENLSRKIKEPRGRKIRISNYIKELAKKIKEEEKKKEEYHEIYLKELKMLEERDEKITKEKEKNRTKISQEVIDFLKDSHQKIQNLINQ